MVDGVFVFVVKGLQDVDLFIELSNKFFYLVFCFFYNNRIAVNTRDFTCRGRYTFKIDITPCENDGYPIQEADCVFGENRYRILLSSCYFNLISETEEPVGIIGNTLFSLPTFTSKR